jgi:peptidoglycan/xylan/chitin deacetylase (PgdA/CDA1 family)/folate-dependent phosphoribosylglycinamide formyltransferase PurN
MPHALRRRIGDALAPRVTLDPVRRLGRLRLDVTGTSEDELAGLLAPLQPVDLDELAARTSVRLDADPNSPATAAWLEELRPDLILVFGGRILREPWLSLAPLGALNMHYGMLPEYGGAASTEYALYHDRLDLVGATIHSIEAGVDSGAIVDRRPVVPEPLESLERCRARVYREGLEALVARAEAVAAGAASEGRPQERTTVYRRGAAALFVEAAAQIRLDTASSFPQVERGIESAPRGRGLLGRLAAGRLPAGVYVLLYHSIVDEDSAEPWERAFTVAGTRLRDFREHAEYLASRFTPIQLDDARSLLREGPADRPYVVLTFDDGYRNLLDNAAPVCRELGLRPTVFACASFAAGEAVNYRVLLATLIRLGHADRAAAIVRDQLGDPGFDERALWTRSKDAYRRGETEAAVRRAWHELVGELPQAHLSFDELRRLIDDGWTVGNHTLEHVPLVGLELGEIERQVDENERRLAAAGIVTVPWLSYPLGRSTHVDVTLGAFMDARPSISGIFAGGGVNLVAARKDWLRTGVVDQSVTTLRHDLFRETRATLLTLEHLARNGSGA